MNMNQTIFTITLGDVSIVIGIIVTLIFISFIMPRICFWLYQKYGETSAKETLKEIIYHLDSYADAMSNPAKRAQAITEVQSYLSLNKKLRVPSFVIGWIVDAQVRQIRLLQEAYGNEGLDTDLHK